MLQQRFRPCTQPLDIAIAVCVTIAAIYTQIAFSYTLFSLMR